MIRPPVWEFGSRGRSKRNGSKRNASGAARFGAHGVEADTSLPTPPFEAVENDPRRTSCRPVVLMHNHPGGDPTPSSADIEMTRVIVEIAKQFGIAIQGHVIVGKQGHASLKGLKLI